VVDLRHGQPRLEGVVSACENCSRIDIFEKFAGRAGLGAGAGAAAGLGDCAMTRFASSPKTRLNDFCVQAGQGFERPVIRVAGVDLQGPHAFRQLGFVLGHFPPRMR
jgi:hypothetical protein